jgi:two-component system response regulator YesN
MRLSQLDLASIQQVKDFLNKEYKYKLTQALLARRFHINESKLRKGFTFVYKTAIYEYQLSIRIEKAKELLTATDEPVKLIASKVGYNIKSLEKQFKKLSGLSPYEWRKKYAPAQSTGIGV